MPLLSKARMLPKLRERAVDVKEFRYQGVEILGAAAGIGTDNLPNLPSGTEPLWSIDPDPPATPALSVESGPTEEEIQAREQQAWQKGFEDAAAQGRENLEKALAADRSEVAAALSEFAKGRESHYQHLEGEVVQLVLSITRKVLHREAQVDPMLLTGVVRVALEKIANGTAVKVRVPPNQADSWRAAIGKIHDLTIEVAADDSLNGPRCVIVTEMGATDVSLDSQLAEIERGFLDLLKERPGSAPEKPQLHL
ncbi:MAG: FliH/SctL family protein [Terriglobia bacterium]